jgi:hypothetical protein
MRIKHVVVGAIVAVSMVACSQKDREPFRDAPVSDRNEAPAEVMTMPDGFSNVAHKCDGHGHRVYTGYKGDANRSTIAVIEDPTCRDGR